MLISTKLQDNGTLPKVAAEWMNENGNKIGGNNQSIEKYELDSIARNAKDPLWRGLAEESSKNFSEAAKLGNTDQSLDERERKFFAERQMLPTRDEHVDTAIKNLEKNLGNNDKYAFSRFHSEISQRFPRENAAERVDTWNALQDKLNGLDGRLRQLLPKFIQGRPRR